MALISSLPTPLEAADRLSDAIGGPRILVKRDDLTGLALGGNKVRKLERLATDAIARDCDVLVTGGGVQSNHARVTAAAARRLGLQCHLVLGGTDPARTTGNLVLDRLLGATLEFVDAPGYYDVEIAIDTAAERLEAEGRRPYRIPVGGASVPGVLAYVDAAHELTSQLDALGARADWVVVADGSGGTHAGLLAGLDASVRVLGVDVGTRPDLDDAVPRLARAAAEMNGGPTELGTAFVDHKHAGDHYGAVTADAVEAIRLVASTEGLLLDPVYTGKAVAALVTAARTGRIASTETVVFVHTGGAPALFADRYSGLWDGVWDGVPGRASTERSKRVRE